MIRFLLIFFIFRVFSYAEPPNLLQQAAMHLRRIEKALEEHSSVYQQTLIDGDSILDARMMLETLEENAHLVSRDCRQDVGEIVKALAEFGLNAINGTSTLSDFDKEVILPLLDSAGRFGPGILRGHIYFAGHFSECKAIDFPIEGRERRLKGEYFRIAVDIAVKNNTENGTCSRGGEFNIRLGFKFGVCLPAGCSTADLMNVFRPESGDPLFTAPICNVQRTNDAVPPLDAGFYITASIMGLIALIGILAAIVDFFFLETAQRAGITNTKSYRIFMAFSLYTNVSSIFDVSEANKAGQIGPMHCIRFFSMSWVVLGHFSSTYMLFSANPFDIIKLSKDLFSEFIINPYFAVDSFFFMSGVLLTFIWFKNYKKNPQATNSPFAWIMFYVHRFVRLSPPYYMAVAFYAFVYKQLFIDLPYNMTALYNSDFCSDTWWISFLYAQNWWKQDKQCLSVSWYLASEMQMFLFTPLLIIPLAIKPVLGVIIGIAMLAFSTAVNIFLVYYYHWPTGGAFFTPDPEMTNYLEDYTMLMYDSPLIRCQIYIMGMLVGWFLQTKKRLSINPAINLACWILGGSLMLCVILGLHDQTNGFYVPIFWRAMYSALSRIAWGVGLSWIIISCWYGYGGPINKFMSWHIWIPFGRLTYCGYLTHIPIISIVLGQSTDTVFFTTFLEALITRVVPIIGITFLVSTFWSALFEISIQMILLGNLRLSPSQKKQRNIEESSTYKSPNEEEKTEERL